MEIHAKAIKMENSVLRINKYHAIFIARTLNSMRPHFHAVARLCNLKRPEKY
jgi:hypothetical protein